ncbi:myosin-17-like isoform X2 [Carex rostrata]
MAQLIWGCSLRQRNEVDAVSYHGKMPRTGDSSYYNFTQPTMQSEALMKTPSYTNLQIYRLLKPSNFQINPNISLQVEFGGFLEPISMTQAGYTTKKEFGEFLRSFGVLAPEILSENNGERFACLKLLDKLGLTNYQVFLRASHMAELVAQKTKVLERAARTIQRPIHASMLRKEFLLLRQAAIDMQSLCRGMLARKTYETRVKAMTETKTQSLEVEFKLRKVTEEASRIQEEEEWLNKCTSQNLGFPCGRPVAACMIHKFILHWRFSEVEKARFFDQIIENMATSIEQCSNEKLAYWLSNSSSLLALLQRKSSANGVGNSTSERRRIHLVQLFKQKLTIFIEKIYGMIRENIKNEISPELVFCIQIPRKSFASMSKTKCHRGNHVVAHYNVMVHWQCITKSLTNYLNILKANHVPPLLVHKLFTQVFSFINVQLFNSLLLRRECCSFSNGKYVKHGLTKFENWCFCATEEHLDSAWDQLKHIRQAVEFLVTQGKPEMTVEKVTKCLCPELSALQLHRICTMFWDDRHGTKSVPPEVIEMLRLKTTVGSSFLLDDDSSIPFSADEICKSMAPIETSDIHLPPLIRNKYGCKLSPIEERINNIALIFNSA